MVDPKTTLQKQRKGTIAHLRDVFLRHLVYTQDRRIPISDLDTTYCTSVDQEFDAAYKELRQGCNGCDRLVSAKIRASLNALKK